MASPCSAVASSWKAAFSGRTSSILPIPVRTSMAASGSRPGVSSMSPRSVSSSRDCVNFSTLMSRDRVTSRSGPTTSVAVNAPRSMLIRPGTACTLISVLRSPSNCSGLARFLKSSVPR